MDNRKKGIILILLSALFFASMAATVKFLDRIPVVEKIFFRNLLGLFVASYLVIKNKKPILGNNKKFLILRSIFGLLGVAAYFYALSNLPLADTVILNKMSPFFVLVLSAFFLGEKIKPFQILSLIFALIGASLVVKPEFDISVIPYIIALLSAFFAGSAYTIIRHLRHTDSSETIIFYFTFISTITMIPFMLSGQFVIPNSIEIIGLLGLGVFATTAQFLMTNAYRFAPAGELAIYTYTNIVFSTIIGIIIWSEFPGILSILGGLLIIIAGFINYYSNKKKA
ncbi:DMT family transporter [Clostridium sp. D2Q-11]|uniref:DMT family transporter n=1 Tax=Anaeromonas frigoriresistens TaxID=2683708 RepID=A0A942UZY9_9FIRM|nr:DMT family transporter [Anaeromonas frigoriresistens]MBS4540146.1 DMT family transporter [Anaeromonas frigoriresistens]